MFIAQSFGPSLHILKSQLTGISPLVLRRLICFDGANKGRCQLLRGLWRDGVMEDRACQSTETIINNRWSLYNSWFSRRPTCQLPAEESKHSSSVSCLHILQRKLICFVSVLETCWRQYEDVGSSSASLKDQIPILHISIIEQEHVAFLFFVRLYYKNISRTISIRGKPTSLIHTFQTSQPE